VEEMLGASDQPQLQTETVATDRAIETQILSEDEGVNAI
jgi:hypothetical protein